MLTPGSIVAAIALLLAFTQASAAEVYRCTVDGKTVYTSEPCRDGKKLDLPLNAIAPTDQSAERAKSAAIDKAARERIDRQVEIGALNAQRNARFYQLCQGIRDTITRQGAWRDNAYSEAVAASARAEIAIQNRKLQDYGCN